MRHTLGIFFSLLAFWLLLSGQWHFSASGDLYLLGCGIVSCLFVTYIASRKGLVDREGHPAHLLVGMLTYIPWLIWEVVVANLEVTKTVWSLRPVITPRLITVPFDLKTDLLTVIYANSITLTPGTVTVSVDTDKKEMIVHALTKKAAAGLLSGKMHAKVKKLEV